MELEEIIYEDGVDAASRLNDRADACQAAGKYAEAESLYKQSIAILEEDLGVEHPDLANVLNNLAFLKQLLGNSLEAEAISRRSLEITEGVLQRVSAGEIGY